VVLSGANEHPSGLMEITGWVAGDRGCWIARTWCIDGKWDWGGVGSWRYGGAECGGVPIWRQAQCRVRKFDGEQLWVGVRVGELRFSGRDCNVYQEHWGYGGVEWGE
jgi:hypothetical protein